MINHLVENPHKTHWNQLTIQVCYHSKVDTHYKANSMHAD